MAKGTKIIKQGVAHQVPKDLRVVLSADEKLLSNWNNLTPLARNEWICWLVSVKKVSTRHQHLIRLQEEISAGKKRPCCWAGCSHRDKNRSVKLSKVVV